MESDSDAALILAVAQRRDQNAFACLCSRYERKIYSLAFHILGKHDLAEEAVQETLVRIWNSANSFKPDGNASGWIMRIVSTESLMLLRQRRRQTKRESLSAELKMQESAMESAAESQKTELLACLRNALDSLPATDRQLVALYYGGGLSQTAIAAEMGMPQTSVSSRIQKSLDELRARLLRAGMAAAVPAVLEDAVREALCGGHDLPKGLTQEFLKQICTNGHRPVLQRSSLGTSKAGKLIPLATLFGVVACGVAWYGWTRVIPSPHNQQAESSATNSSRPVRYERVWNFNSGAPVDVHIAFGEWKHVPTGGPDGSGCMEIVSDFFCADIEIPAGPLPLIVEMNEMSIPGSKDYYLAADWSELDSQATFRNLGSKVEHTNPEWANNVTYVTGDSLDTWLMGKRTGFIMVKPAAGARLSIVARGHHKIDDLKIHAARLEELPDTSAFRREFESIPLDARVGKVAVKELKPARNVDEGVFIQFSTPDKNRK